MNILHILESLQLGGAEILVLNMLEYCNNYPDIKFFLVYSKDGLLNEKLKLKRIKNYKIKKKYRFDIRYIFGIRKVIANCKINIIHVHQPLTALYTILAALFFKTKIVLTHHGFYNDLKTRAIIFFIRNFVDVNIAVSNSFIEVGKSTLKYFNKINFHVVYNGVNIIDYFSKDDNIRKELNISDKDTLMVMVGNFTSDKIYKTKFKRDHMTVCKAVKIIIEKYPEIKMIFAGRKTGISYKKCLEYCHSNNLEKNVFFIGERNDIPSILNCNIAIYSSLGDTFGLVLVEYMLAGIPIVVNDYPVFIEITGGGKYAKIFKTEDENDLANQIEFVLKQDQCEKEMKAKETKNWALTQFDISENVEKTIEIYKNLFNTT